MLLRSWFSDGKCIWLVKTCSNYRRCSLLCGFSSVLVCITEPVESVPLLCEGFMLEHILLLFWHAPLGVHSAIHRHQPPPRVVLGQADCFVQCEVVGSQISLDGVQPHDTRTPWWSLPVVYWGSR